MNTKMVIKNEHEVKIFKKYQYKHDIKNEHDIRICKVMNIK